MDDELGVKVTRLRRRLSVEAEAAQSPASSAPSTPTKKRGTRLAKPALELIDENVTEDVPKRATRKSIARDVIDPVEEKAVTPSRRSARIRSNTSLVLETPQNVVDSPRARRANRRTSLLGSDTETVTTPARIRRTRKDSTSSVDKLAVTNPSETVTAQVAEPIAEEPEKEVTKDKLDVTEKQSPTLRKSPRLNKKDRKSIDDAIKDINEKRKKKEKTFDNSTISVNESLPTINNPDTTDVTSSPNNDKTESKPETKDSEKENVSINSANLINEIDTNPKISSILNKTVSVIEDVNNDKSNRKRTKSWTTITNSMSKEVGNLNHSGSGDNLLRTKEEVDVKSPNKSSLIYNSSIENKENILIMKSTSVLNKSDTLKLLEKTPSKDMQSVVLLEDSDSNSGKLIMDLENNGQKHNDSGDQCVPVVPAPKRLASESFTVEPMDIDETIPGNVTINDFSDKTNSSREEDKMPDSKRKSSISNQSSDMNASFNKSKRTSSISIQQESNSSKRKSSIGTLEEDKEKSSILIQDENEQNSNKSKRKSSLSKETNVDKRKSSASPQVEDSGKINESVDKSKRKSISDGDPQHLEKTSNENKSTLVLSHLKDVSTNEMSNVSKSANDSNNELSKSVNVPAHDTDKKILSLTYQTSTPLQQKSLQKMAMQINTSMISPNIESKNTSKVQKTPVTNKNESNTMHNSESSDDESESRERSAMIDDEAEEASGNYESGDSRNDEDKQYEKDHEIIEKGETLDSEEEELSDDSEYEKDSFIVSSNEEDNDLLSGSGDDLSTSDNELKMSAKSKKKFNERKRKEQKKASKEMYEARHSLNNSDKSNKLNAKKSKRQRLESSMIESEKEEEEQPKKKKRLRIDSSQDVSLNDTNESIRFKKKKVKQLSESVCEENIDGNEKEITILNQSVAEKRDPLSAAVKQEPKTPQKDFNISTVHITDDIEEVQVDANASVMKPKETSDPLQATLAQDEESDSDISENMEIRDNYESVLENLNKGNNLLKIKTLDTSLNLNKKSKTKKEPIVEELNLTEVKKYKKNKADKVAKENKTNNEPQEETSTILSKNEEAETSDSIDMKLLFPEDSNDSEVNATKFKLDEHISQEPAEVFIPLKRTEAKTNVRESLELDTSKNDLNVSQKKNKNRKSAQLAPELTNAETEDTSVNFFIDTKGDFEDADEVSTHSAKKNKKKHKENVELSQSAVEFNGTLLDSTAIEETPQNTSVKSDKKKKKKKNKSLNASQIVDEPDSSVLDVSVISDTKNKSHVAVPEETAVNVSLKNEKKKRKKNKSLNISETGEVPQDTTLQDLFGSVEKNTSNIAVPEERVNVSVKSEKKKNKKNKSLNISEAEAPQETTLQVLFASDEKNSSNIAVPGETSLNVSLKSQKKKNKKNKSLTISETGEVPQETTLQVLFTSDEKNTSNIAGSEEAAVNVSLKSEKKKSKKNKSLDTIENDVNTGADETPQSEKKKKKKKSKSLDSSQIVESTACEEAPIEILTRTDKKKRKRDKIFEGSAIDKRVTEETLLNGTPKRKKKNKLIECSETLNNTECEETIENVSLKSDKKKKKSKSREITDNCDNDIAACEDTLQNDILKTNKKKKRSKSSHEITENCDKIAVPESTLVNMTLESKKKKDKKNKLTEDISIACEETLSLQNDSLKTNKKKKRSKSHEVSELYATENAVNKETSLDASLKSDKKKKRNKVMDDSKKITLDDSANEKIPVDISLKSDKKKKRKKSHKVPDTVGNTAVEEEAVNISVKSDKKKKKKKRSADVSQDDQGGESDDAPMEVSYKSVKKSDVPEPEEDKSAQPVKHKKNKKKKKKNSLQTDTVVAGGTPEGSLSSKKRKRDVDSTPSSDVADDEIKVTSQNKKIKFSENAELDDVAATGDVTKIKSKKRKATEGDTSLKKSKVSKENSFDKVHVPRLPDSIVDQLDDKPKESKKQKKMKAISTMSFEVVDAKKRKNKPSNYLEESIYLNDADDSPVQQKQKSTIKKPKVLPFVPTAITSGKGFTSNFKINVLPQETQFVAQASDATNFKNEFLANQRIKRLKTFERFKKQRNHKLSKF